MKNVFNKIISDVKQNKNFIPRDYQSMGGMWTVETWIKDDFKVQVMDEGYTTRLCYMSEGKVLWSIMDGVKGYTLDGITEEEFIENFTPEKILTPMSKLKNQFSDFKHLLEKKQFREVALNKAEPKSKEGYTNFCGEDIYFTKEVKSDFIKLFQSKEIAKSIGFSFSYLDTQEESWTVGVTIKNLNSKSFIMTEPILFKDFKDEFNNIIEKLKEQKLNAEETIALITDSFKLVDKKEKKKRNKI